MNFIGKEVHTKSTKVQRSQRGVKGYCPMAMYEPHDKITDKNPSFLFFVSFVFFVIFVRIFSKNFLEYRIDV